METLSKLNLSLCTEHLLHLKGSLNYFSILSMNEIISKFWYKYMLYHSVLLLQIILPTSMTGRILDSLLGCGFSTDFQFLFARVIEGFLLRIGLSFFALICLDLIFKKGLWSASSIQGYIISMLPCFLFGEGKSSNKILVWVSCKLLWVCSSSFIYYISLYRSQEISLLHQWYTLGGDPVHTIFIHSFFLGLSVLPFQSILV